MQREHGLDVHGRDVFATADNHVVNATSHEEVTLCIEVARVTREIPAVAQAACVRFGAFVIALEGFVAEEVGHYLAFFQRRCHVFRALGIELDDTQSCVDACTSRRAGLTHGVLID